MHKWSVFTTFDEAAKAAAVFLAQQIGNSIQQRDICHVILSGGNTPPPCLTYLSGHKLPWHKVHWYPGDERCYPQGHAERNDVMLQTYLWSKLSTTNVHTIPAELGAEAAALAFAKVIQDVDCFDIAFLGMGEDGHTASLFPGNPALQDQRRIVPVYDSPKPPSERVSFGLQTLKAARHKMVLASGAAKAGVIARIKEGEPLPINCIGDIHWYIDMTAAAAG